jgi:parallel beta-helix repeat protein
MLMLFLITGTLSIIGSASAASTNNTTALNVYPGNSIQAVVDNSTSDQIIKIHDNNGKAYTYNENLILNRTVNLMGVGNVIINAANPNAPVITLDAGAVNSTITGLDITGAVNSNGINLDSTKGCNITNCTVNGNYIGLFLQNSTYITVSKNIIENNSWTGIYINGCSDRNTPASDVNTGNMGTSDPTRMSKIVYIVNNNINYNYMGIITTNYSRWVWIINNNISYNINTGVKVIGSYNHVIQNNTVTNNLIGIFLQNCPNGMGMYECTCGCDWGNDIENNTIANNTLSGVYLDTATGNFILTNKIMQNTEGVFISNASNDNMINGNSITNNYLAGITISNNSTSNTISENSQISQNSIGVYIQNSIENTIKLNTISTNNWSGVSLNGASYNNIQTNEINGNTGGILAANNSNGNSFKINTITNNTNNGISILNSNNNKITQNIAISNNKFIGVFIQNSTNTLVQGNDINNNGYYGVDLEASTQTTVKQNNIENNLEQAIADNGSINTFNSNYWSDWTNAGKARPIAGNENLTDKNPQTYHTKKIYFNLNIFLKILNL